ncbi:12161_t:CDS:2 [Acaulospora colombiana]|uniref:12161_t:CDS:1 n=1 Tax=Acaulospora colombiana TaxID=27376 RepID=A0ACA9MKM2_9GLOM|nr:12161_t:CDS:2 [Acaulospora colombiana]
MSFPNKRIIARDVTTSVDQPTSTNTKTSTSFDNKLNEPAAIALIAIAISVLVIEKQSRGLKPFYLHPRIEPVQHQRSRKSPKAPTYDSNITDFEEEGKEEPFEESYAEGAVGSAAVASQHPGRNIPTRSQTMYGTTNPSSSTHYPILQEHHFMSSDQNDNNNN